MRGIYVEQEADAEAALPTHPVRTALCLYPKAHLPSGSAELLMPTPDGGLLISGRRNQRTRPRGLEINQKEAPSYPPRLQRWSARTLASCGSTSLCRGSAFSKPCLMNWANKTRTTSSSSRCLAAEGGRGRYASMICNKMNWVLAAAHPPRREPVERCELALVGDR